MLANENSYFACAELHQAASSNVSRSTQRTAKITESKQLAANPAAIKASRAHYPILQIPTPAVKVTHEARDKCSLVFPFKFSSDCS